MKDRPLVNRVRAADWDVRALANELESAIKAQGHKPELKQKTSFAPSSLAYQSGKCPRRWRLLFNDPVLYDSKADAVGILTMQYGTDLHEFIQNSLANSGMLVEAERELIHDDPHIKGYIDLVLDINGVPVLGEIKTTRVESFIARESQGTAMDYHMYQLLSYMSILNIEHGVFVYVNRNDLSISLIPIRLSDNTDIIEEAFEWMRMVESSKELPTRPFRKNSKACQSCPVLDACALAGPGDVDLPVMKVNSWRPY